MLTMPLSSSAPVVAAALPRRYVDRIRSRLGSDAQIIDVLAGEALNPAPPPAAGLMLPRGLRSAQMPTLLAMIEKVDWIHFLSAGVDGFPLELLAGRTITCGRGANSAAIAELTVSLLLAAEKRIPDIWEASINSRFATEPLGTLVGRTIGLIGFGSIAQQLARRLDGFDTRLVAFRRTGRPAELPGVTIVPTLPDLLGQADHLVITAPLTPQTDQMLNDEAFAVAKPGLHLINVARGRIVDTDALVRALAADIVRGASLDVTDPEPLPDDHPLRHHPRVRIMPHVSWSAPDDLGRGIDLFASNLRHRQAGRPLDGLVDLEAGY